MNIRHVDSLDIEELKVYTKYNERELMHIYAPDRGVFIAETPDIIENALDRGCEPLSFLIENKVFDTDASKLIEPYSDIPVFTAPLNVINKITGFNLTRGVLCVMRRPSMPELRDIVSSSKNIALFEDIENPTNIGALFRCAAALGADGIILTDGCTDPLYRRSARVSMGAVFKIPWVKVSSKSVLDELKNTEFKIISMALNENAISINDFNIDSNDKRAVVFGNERSGISKEVLSKSDYIIKIPMKNGVDSLNVSSAGAIAFYKFFNID